MVRLHQIVAGIPAVGDSPVVVFDFDEWFTLGVGTDFSPPDVRVSNVWTQLNDGETTGASTLGDRVIRLVLTQFRGNAEDQAEVLQTLGGLLNDPRGQWFLWQDEGTVHERFFRTKRASTPIDDHYLLERPKRTLTLSIPAEPSAYGRPITGSFTIANDPTDPTNPNCYVFGPVKGDIPTPLWLQYTPGSGEFSTNGLVFSSVAMPPGEGFNALPLTETFSLTFPPTGWTDTDPFVTSAAVGGAVARVTRASGVTSRLQVADWEIDSPPPGDYHLAVLLRITSGDDVTITPTLQPVGGTPILEMAPRTVDSLAGVFQWVDFGVVRAPFLAPQAQSPLSPQPVLGASTLRGHFALEIPDPASIDFDVLALIPAGIDDQVYGTYGSYSLEVSSQDTAVFDPFSEVVFNGFVAPSTYPKQDQNALAGDFPYLVPGADNTLFVIRGCDVAVYDPDTHDMPMDYLYYPRYLYIRSATG